MRSVRLLILMIGGCTLCLPNLYPVLGEEKPVQPLTGLVGWWPFDENGGNTAADLCPTPHPATLEGQAKFVAGRIGNAISLDGKGSRLRVPGFKGITGTSPRTVSAWIKTSTASGQIVAWGSEEPGKMWIFGFVRSRIGVTPRGGYLYVKEPLHDGNWHHVAVVLEEGSPPNLHDHARIFVDGELAEIHDIGLLDLWPIETGDTLDVTIGQGFNGLIDDLRIYARVLTEEEIRSLFKAPETLKQSQ
ncbi:MAG: LamG domain-containing protein [Thermogutta sp.]|nr:LamG domain-containing protein [Thermogutta sp.]